MSNNLFNKSEKILDQITKGLIDKDTVIKQVNSMDEMITQAMIRSEIVNCKKKDEALWTPAIKQSSLRIQYWNIRKKAVQQGIDCSKRIKDIIGKMDSNSKEIMKSNKK
jgi:hypothetical protein